MSDHTKARLQDKALDKCPKCGSKQHYETELSGPIVVYECGSSRIKNGHYVMQTDRCRIKCLEAQIKQLDEIEKELTTAKNLLADILPLAMGASCKYSDHPEADVSQHCCDWGPIVDRICETLGREKPKTGLGAWYKQLHHPGGVSHETD